MKIFLDNKVYVSKHDIGFILRNNIPIPHMVALEMGTEVMNECLDPDAYIKHEFVKFESSVAINFFAKEDQIIDYDIYKSFHTSRIRNMIQLFRIQKKLAKNSLGGIAINDITNINKYEYEIDSYNHMMLSLAEIIRYRNKEFKLPSRDKYFDHKCFLINMFNSGKNAYMCEVSNEKIYRK